MTRSSFRLGCGFALVALLPGCMHGYGDETGTARVALVPVAQAAPNAMALRAESGAPLLDRLQGRLGAIIPGTPYAAIARAVLESDAFRAESELRVAQLRGEAEELAWLPELDPVLSLSALRRMAEGLRLRPERFDTPRKRAERDFALAEIDNAALTYAEGANAQVFDAITQHIAAEEARAGAALYDAAYRNFATLDWPVSQAVATGAQPAEALSELRAQVARLRENRAASAARQAAAQAELATMGSSRLGGVEGIGTFRELVTSTPLSLLQVQVAQARLEAEQRRSAHLMVDGLEPRRSAEELAALDEATGFDGEGGDTGTWELPAPENRWTQPAVVSEEREIGDTAREQEALRVAHREATAARDAAVAAAMRAWQMWQAGQWPAARLVGPLTQSLEAQEAEIAQRFALAQAELRLAYLRGTLVAGSAL